MNEGVVVCLLVVLWELSHLVHNHTFLVATLLPSCMVKTCTMFGSAVF